MPNFVFNRSKGEVAAYARRVNDNDPGASTLIIVAINRGSATDDTLRTYASLEALLADAQVTEANNTGYAPIELDDAAGTTVNQNNTLHRKEVDSPDQVFPSVQADGSPNNWTDLVFCYAPAGVGGSNANKIPLTSHVFASTPDGSNINVPINGWFIGS